VRRPCKESIITAIAEMRILNESISYAELYEYRHKLKYAGDRCLTKKAEKFQPFRFYQNY
jgi:hypothetical protein